MAEDVVHRGHVVRRTRNGKGWYLVTKDEAGRTISEADSKGFLTVEEAKTWLDEHE